MDSNQHVLILGFVWPEPDSSAAGHRMMQLVSLFRQQGWKVTFASGAAESDYMGNLEAYGVETVQIKVNSSSFDEFIRELQPSVVLFDRFVTEEQFGWRVAEQCPQAIRILDTEDLHCLRRARKKAVKQDQSFTEQDLLADRDAKREIASIYRCDLTLMISKAEMKLLENIFEVDTDLLQYVPFLLDKIDEDTIQKWPDFDERNHFVTIGNFQHPPNVDAVEYLREDIWPRIQKALPRAEMHIYGAYPHQHVEQMHNPEDGFLIKGRAEEARQVVEQGKVLLAPLRFGAGLKGKLVEAMQCGTPSVTSAIGAEGINGDLPWSGKIADNTDEIAEAAVKLFTNEKKWSEAQKNGIQIINKRFANQKYGSKLIDKMTFIRDNLEDHRVENFTGQMLMHHTVASTKYMSRWIEEKNSNR